MNVVLCDAIREHRLVRFVYDGYERIVEPHVYGRTRTGRELLAGWLVGGWSASEPEPGWRTYRVEAMHDVVAAAQRFAPLRVRFPREDHRFEEIYCQAAPADAVPEPATDIAQRRTPAEAEQEEKTRPLSGP
jgi:hypothetical protein